MEQAVQQFLGRGRQQFGLAQGVEQRAGAGPAVVVALVARQLLQQQAGSTAAAGGQQQARRQLLGLAEVVLERFIQFWRGQCDQALVALRFARIQARIFDGDGQQRVLTQVGQVAGGVTAFGQLDDAAQGAGGSAFGEQRAQGRVAAQLDRQAAVHLGVAGEQRRGHAGLAEQFGGTVRILAVGLDVLPGGLQAHVDATDTGVGEQETDKGIGLGGHRLTSRGNGDGCRIMRRQPGIRRMHQ
ncbi:hypothetical protein D3C73_1108840 [compost metagenome]